MILLLNSQDFPCYPICYWFYLQIILVLTAFAALEPIAAVYGVPGDIPYTGLPLEARTDLITPALSAETTDSEVEARTFDDEPEARSLNENPKATLSNFDFLVPQPLTPETKTKSGSDPEPKLIEDEQKANIETVANAQILPTPPVFFLPQFYGYGYPLYNPQYNPQYTFFG